MNYEEQRMAFWRDEFYCPALTRAQFTRTNASPNLKSALPQKWEVLQDGDVIPDGVVWETRKVWLDPRQNDSASVRVYRITGIADGWTDE